ncbi:SDR family oxidoreductase [Parvibaculaceae bacterium PLY_AMNH_Bact1]|nr:SDR family oxidoreductase [Parvibaculaceae bacterium PLY_AMNH_Bact1]
MRKADKSCEGKVAIVAGASSGIGRATARRLAAEGAAIVAGARRQVELDSLVSEIKSDGGRAVAVVGDATQEAFSRDLVERACLDFGGLDVAVNAAGTLGPMGPMVDLSCDQWNAVLSTNLTSAFLGAKHQIPAMLERGAGSIIFVSSFVGHTAAMPGVAAYAASKAGMIGLMKSLAVEYGAEGIRSNALLPGGTQTAMADVMADTDEMRQFVREMHALKRISEPHEQAEAALFLASDASSFVTGTAMLVDGGVSISKT